MELTTKSLLMWAGVLAQSSNALGECAVSIVETVGELKAAEAKLPPLKQGLRDARADLDAAINDEQTLQTAIFQIANAKGKGEAAAQGGIITAGDADGRKKQLEAHLNKLARDPKTPIGEATRRTRGIEGEVMNLEMQIAAAERDYKAAIYIKDTVIAQANAAAVLVETLTAVTMAVEQRAIRLPQIA